MKMIFIVLSLLVSFSAFSAEKMNVACNVGIEGDRYLELEMDFANSPDVNSYLLVDGLKIPLPQTEVELSDGLTTVTNYVAQEDVQKVIIPVPHDIFSDSGTFYLLPVLADDRNTYAVCVSF